ncbi:Bax inhibitor-1/YccA family protein [Dactylosporangium sp. NPDC005572]|uniref:Bax inhibitor-1/YccA family protein n=1 Tax=Dactylosporangium sp. NPDC005572 TaxID=3156889 RepID=UPI00339DB9DC
MQSSNPVLGRLSAAAYQPTYQVPGGHDVQTGRRDVMSIDDVVVKTVSLLGAAALAAGVTWVLVPVQSIGPVWIASMLIGLVLGLVISFAQITNPVILFAYALVEGVFLGAVSKAYETRWNGIVLLAVIATLSVFFVMAALYKARIIRASAKFTRIVIGAAAGLAVVMLLNVVITMFTGSAGPLRDGGPFAILFSLVCIVVAALMFVITFNQIEEDIAAGLPRNHGWLAAFGILVELVWLYLEFLRLISYFQED